VVKESDLRSLGEIRVGSIPTAHTSYILQSEFVRVVKENVSRTFGEILMGSSPIAHKESNITYRVRRPGSLVRDLSSVRRAHD
jgi:hypothetical protein